MNAADLRAEAAVEFEHMARVVGELHALRRDVGDRAPALRETVAAGSFLMQFYNGAENLMKRISVHHGVPLPTGDRWHTDPFLRFCDPPHDGLPLLFDASLADEMRPFRTFRHVARTSYGVDLEWGMVATGIDRIGPVFARFRTAVTEHVDGLD